MADPVKLTGDNVRLMAKDSSGNDVILKCDADGKLIIEAEISATIDTVGIENVAGTKINPATEDGALASIKTNTDNLAGKNVSLYSGTVSASGDTTIITATAGKKLRVRYVNMNNAGASDITVYFKLDGFNSGGAIYSKLLKSGSMFATKIAGLNEYHEGSIRVAGATGTLVVNLSGTGTVYVDVRYEEA